jgi:hypothetical protein
MANVTRATRTPISRQRHILTYSEKDPAYVYRFFNDQGDRIQQALAAGYEFIEKGKGEVGEKRVGTASSVGSHESRPVGGGAVAVLMRIKKEWYDEDQEANLVQVRQQLADLGHISGVNNQYGGIKIS